MKSTDEVLGPLWELASTSHSGKLPELRESSWGPGSIRLSYADESQRKLLPFCAAPE